MTNEEKLASLEWLETSVDKLAENPAMTIARAGAPMTYAYHAMLNVMRAHIRMLREDIGVAKSEQWYITAEWVNDGHHRQLTLTKLPFNEHDEPVYAPPLVEGGRMKLRKRVRAFMERVERLADDMVELRRLWVSIRDRVAVLEQKPGKRLYRVEFRVVVGAQILGSFTFGREQLDALWKDGLVSGGTRWQPDYMGPGSNPEGLAVTSVRVLYE